ncbi:MAG: hypothetical protein JNK67_17310 [Alphaproteobacteria bacterium]|nr:hypothetical protein [Alphaproteobacteria bacterium]
MLDVKGAISDWLERRSMRRHRSRIGWRLAPRYSDYLERCRRENPLKPDLDPAVAAAVETFRRDGVASFWTPRTRAVADAVRSGLELREAAGEAVWKPINDYAVRNYAGDAWLDFPAFEELFAGDLGGFLSAYFGSAFKILYGAMYRSEHLQEHRIGSQMWHSDSGPGICINVMFYLHDTTPANGPLEALPWNRSLALYETEKRLMRRGALDRYGASKRDRISNWYAERIAAGDGGPVLQPSGQAGLVVPFLNNTLHRGGYPAAGHARTAIVFHCYPSHRAIDLARYRAKGIAKSAPYPADPAAEF